VLLLVALAAPGLPRLTAEAGGTGSQAATAPVAERVTVAPGETLWQIAERVRPAADPRATVARIRNMNGLASSSVLAGRVLLVPAG
jgi:LysM repeat protein